MSIVKKYRSIKRYKEISEVLFKYGFDFLGEKILRRKFIPKIIKKRYDNNHLSIPERIKLVLEELGPSYIKLGQIISTREDIFGLEIAKELSKLQDKSKEVDFSEIKPIIESELNDDIDKLFKEIDEKAIATGSIGQVYIAKLFNGEEVILKVQKPNIKERIFSDINILYDIAHYLDKSRILEINHKFASIVKEFEYNILKELDYELELTNLEYFYNKYNSHNILIPKAYKNLSTNKLLTMQYLKGEKIINKNDLNNEFLAKKISEVYVKQIFIDKIFHGDPHPGNLLINEDKVILIDFGLVGYLDKKTSTLLFKLFLAVSKQDMDSIMLLLLDNDIINDQSNIPKIKEEITMLIFQYYDKSIQEINIKKIIKKVFNISYKYNLKFPNNLIILFKTLVSLESSIRKLNPNFNLINNLKPVLLDNISKEEYYKELINDKKNELLLFGYKFKNTINNINSLANKANRNELTFNNNLVLDETLRKTTKEVTKKLSYSLIAASLIIASSLFIIFDVNPKLFQIPIYSLIGYFISGLIFIKLIL